MKSVLAVVTAVIVLVAGWLLIGLMLLLLGYFGAKAAGGVGLMSLINLFLVWVLSPTVGGFLALRITSDLFKSVSIHTIYVGFVSVTAVLLIITSVAGLSTVARGNSPIGPFLFSLLQAAGIFFGAWIGRAVAQVHRQIATAE